MEPHIQEILRVIPTTWGIVVNASSGPGGKAGGKDASGVKAGGTNASGGKDASGGTIWRQRCLWPHIQVARMARTPQLVAKLAANGRVSGKVTVPMPVEAET